MKDKAKVVLVWLFALRRHSLAAPKRPSFEATKRAGLKCLLAPASLFVLCASVALAQTPGYQLTLGWNASPDTKVVGYRLYRGIRSGACTNRIDVGNQLQCTIANLTYGFTNFFAVTAYTAQGRESQPTTEFSDFKAGPSSLPTVPGYQLTLAWNASPDTNVVGYRLYQGIRSGACTNQFDVGNQLQCTVINLAYNATNFFAATAYTAQGLESEPTPELSYFMADPDSLASIQPASLSSQQTPQGADSAIPTPPLPPGGILSLNTTPPANASSPPATNRTETAIEKVAKVIGIPPALWVVYQDQQLAVRVLGTVGATYVLQRSRSQQDPVLWTALTNISITNAVANLAADASLPAILRQAFVPGDEWHVESELAADGPQFYRVVMPYDYAILADLILKPQGYGTRLIDVRMAGTDVHTICYVPQEAGFLRYQPEKGTFRMTSSGSTVRALADQLSASCTENWTTASEFIYTNGTKELVATVAKTDSPQASPVPGTSGDWIVIDF